jgi:RND family efflux transporter MFP subunit
MNKSIVTLGILVLGAAGAITFRDQLPASFRPPSWRDLAVLSGLEAQGPDTASVSTVDAGQGSSHRRDGSQQQAEVGAGAGQGKGQGRGRGSGGSTAVKTVAAATGVLAMDVPATGWAEAADATTIAALQAGPVVEVKAADGETVTAGTVIVRQDDRAALALVAKDEANLASDRASLAEAEAALSRAENLLKQNVQSEQGLEQAKGTRDQAAAKVDADRAILAADQVALDNLSIKAPYDGRLGSIAVSPGSYLSAGASVVTITRSDPIYVNFRLPQRYLPALQQGLTAGATVETDPSATGSVSLLGQLSFFDNSVDQSSGTVLAKAKFQNDRSLLWPGESLAVTVHFHPSEESIIVPTVAVRAGPDGPIVYTTDSERKVHATPVVVFRANGDQTAIASGLAEGQHVVVEGQVQLSNGQTVIEQFADGESGPAPNTSAPAPHAKGAKS